MPSFPLPALPSDTEKTKVVAPSAHVSDMEYINSNDSDDADVSGNENAKMAQELKADSDYDIDTGRLIVRNLTYTTTEEEIMERFSKFGEISEVHLVLDKETKRSKGLAFIHYLIPESASRAMKELDKKVFQGGLLRVSPADKQVAFPNSNDTSFLPKTFNKKEEEQRKASEANGNSEAWNSLFIQPDTALENMVRMYGANKRELLDRASEDPAIRKAKVITETKEALAKAGVNVTSLEEFATRKGKEKIRSNHILLVKNLSSTTSGKELAQMFGKFGSLEKIILPPTKAMALVVFLEPTEAREAMTRMAYRRYLDAPLFLEWAPRDILEPKTLTDNNEKKSDVGENVVRRANLEQQFKIDLDITESNVLYIKNMSIKTSDESLKKHLTELMKKQGKILNVKIIKHLKNGKYHSSGYGFVEFDSIETATSVHRDLQGTRVDGHALKLSFCKNKCCDTVGKGSDKDKACTKLHVKNVAFEATKKELRQLFSPLGQGSYLEGHEWILRFCESKRSGTAGEGSDKEKACTKLHVKTPSDNIEKKSDVGESAVRGSNPEQQSEIDLDTTESVVLSPPSSLPVSIEFLEWRNTLVSAVFHCSCDKVYEVRVYSHKLFLFRKQPGCVAPKMNVDWVRGGQISIECLCPLCNTGFRFTGQGRSAQCDIIP